MKKGIQHTATYRFPLDKLATLFDLKLEIDSYDDVHHQGYSAQEILNADLSMPKGMDNLDKLFPSEVGVALETAEREAWAGSMREANLEALKQSLEKITAHVEYSDDEDDEWVGTDAGVQSVEIVPEENIVKIEIKNPEHLFNGIVAGMGYHYPDLPAEEKAEPEAILKHVGCFRDYFDVYGESLVKPSTAHYPNIDEDFLKSEIEYHLSELSIESIVDAMIDAVGEERLEAGEALKLAAKHTGKDSDRLRMEALKNPTLQSHMESLASVVFEAAASGKILTYINSIADLELGDVYEFALKAQKPGAKVKIVELPDTEWCVVIHAGEASEEELSKEMGEILGIEVSEAAIAAKIPVKKCTQCKKQPAMPIDLQKARVQDIPDGEDLSLGRLCEDCLEAITKEVYESLEQ